MDWAADQKLNRAAQAAGFVVIVRPDPATGQVVGRAYSQEHFTQDFTCVGPSVEHVVRDLTQRLEEYPPSPGSRKPHDGAGRSDGAATPPRATERSGNEKSDGPNVLAPAASVRAMPLSGAGLRAA